MRKRNMAWRKPAWVTVFVFAVVASVGAQEGSIQEANELSQQVLELYSKRRYTEAFPLAERAVAIREKLLGPEHPDTATSLMAYDR